MGDWQSLCVVLALGLGAGCAFDSSFDGDLGETTPETDDGEPEQPETTPEPPAPGCNVWLTTFDSDPTIDGNADGMPDFQLRDGAAFDTDQLRDSGGDDDNRRSAWRAPPDLPLDTFPEVDFVGVTSVRVRMQTASDSGRAQFWINLDHSDGNRSPVVVEITSPDDDHQTVQVFVKTSDSELVRIAERRVSRSAVDVELVADADDDTVAVQIDGRQEGTFPLASYASGNDERFATLVGRDGETEFDSLRVENCP